MEDFNNQNLENNMAGTNKGEPVMPVEDSIVMPTVGAMATPTMETSTEVTTDVNLAPVVEITETTPAVETVAEPVTSNPDAIFSEGPTMPGNVNPLPTIEPKPVAPVVEAAPVAEDTKETKTMLPILLGIIIVLLAAGLVYYAFIRKENCPKPAPLTCPEQEECEIVDEDQIVKEYNEKLEFIELAKKYVDSAKNLWNNGKVTCQNQYAKGVDKENIPFVAPKKLAKKDTYGGEAVYYLFVDNENKEEIDFGVKTDKKIAGWVKIGANGSVYAALSDGTHYLVDKGDNSLQFKDVTYKNIVARGNGNNYQFKNGMILGSQTGGEGWGIGDYAVMSDEDEENNGIYMINGDKNTGWTPYCK